MSSQIDDENERMTEGAEAGGYYEDEDLDEEEGEEAIVAYKTVQAKTAMELDSQVGELLEEGWQPFGSLVALADGQLIQTMVVVE